MAIWYLSLQISVNSLFLDQLFCVPLSTLVVQFVKSIISEQGTYITANRTFYLFPTTTPWLDQPLSVQALSFNALAGLNKTLARPQTHVLPQASRWWRGESGSQPQSRPCRAPGQSLAPRQPPSCSSEPWPSSQLPVQVWTAPGKALTLFSLCVHKIGAARVHLLARDCWHRTAISIHLRQPNCAKGWILGC